MGLKVNEVKMSEQNLGGSNVSDNVTPVASTPAVSAVAPTPAKVFSQEELNEIVGRNKKDAYEHGKRDALATVNQSPAQSQPAPTQSAQSSQMGGVTQLTSEQIQRMIDERAPQAFAQQLQQQQYLNNTTQLIQKLESGKVDYPDFDQRVAALNLPAHSELIPLLNSLDQGVAAGVLSDMADNPRKFADLKVLNMMNPQLAAVELNKLAESIRQNKVAAQVKLPNDPLAQIKTSVTGADNGSLTVADLRKLPQYKV